MPKGQKPLLGISPKEMGIKKENKQPQSLA
jgi:hypothetical protein